MSTPEERDVLKCLVQQVSRAFYEAKYTIIMDQLARHPVLKDDDLASRMGLQPKELNKVIAVLSNDSLVRVYRQNELKEGAQRAVGKQYYYIDYAHFCNVVKWRIAKMHHKIDSTLRNELDNKGYICLQCKQSYTPLDVDKLMDFARGVLVCEICHAEVVDNENAENVQGSEDRMSRFNHQMRFILAGLKQTESMVLPSFDAAAWIKTNLLVRENGDSAQTTGDLKIAGSGPSAARDDGIGIVISSDKDEATMRMERDAQAEIKRQQNALPAWHLKSTISGDLTALGVKENARAEAAAAMQESISSSNDDILRGLGVVGSRPVNGVNATQTTALLTVDQDVKPQIHHEADYYEQYYASLAASAAASAVATPSGLSLPGSSDFDNLEEEEEDRKPTTEYLNSLNDYRKRSRSGEDVGSSGKTKQAKLEESTSRVNGVAANGSASMSMSSRTKDLNGAAKVVHDPLVPVNGISKPLSEVTEEDHELMSPEEYTAYFEILQAQEEVY
ncbi:hypothetical protein E1B28_005754 [Marasmius oreades]|uniref:HTH TFE/IIEalpha-type domain-containing protein n=1 Tax=Marasmius oreades TaxID=181124 RepID=A0A9P7UUX0_9AGAR|nr:uncharacterized protein E1B28_005754 [Marasmius oreades]KAG7094953.1 hypothetical protein E1B28_005754 [Marasmius oreades]